MFHDWGDFFFLIGSAAASLIGLLFVVVTLNRGRERETALKGANTYMTPIVFHFGVVLVLSAAAVAPGLGRTGMGLAEAVCAAIALIYSLIILRRLLAWSKIAPPHWTDAWFYGVAPLAIYVGLAAAAVMVWIAPAWAPYGLALVLLAHLLLGIRNEWDLVTWLAPGLPPEGDQAPPPPAAGG